jgi:peptidoglycan/xylan/chitin deacetylase (PgdA/CDA1 family)
VIRGDTSSKKLALVFTGDEFGDGGNHILQVLKEKHIPASFFLTGNFYINKKFSGLITNLKASGHYLGAHSDKHLLYCDWTKRDSLLITKKQFLNDLSANYSKMELFGIMKSNARFFLPPYEWFNDSISSWSGSTSLQLINFTPGTRSNADYTTPDMKSYRSSEEIFKSIVDYERNNTNGLNGFILLLHIGTDPKRTDKFYYRLGELADLLKDKGYEPVTVDELLNYK